MRSKESIETENNRLFKRLQRKNTRSNESYKYIGLKKIKIGDLSEAL